MENNKNFKKLISKRPSNWKQKANTIIDNPWLIYSSQIARRIAFLIKEKNITQADLAEKIEGKRQQVNRILKGKANMTLKTIYSLSEALEYELITFPHYRLQEKRDVSGSASIAKVVSMEDRPRSITYQTSVNLDTYYEAK